RSCLAFHLLLKWIRLLAGRSTITSNSFSVPWSDFSSLWRSVTWATTPIHAGRSINSCEKLTSHLTRMICDGPPWLRNVPLPGDQTAWMLVGCSPLSRTGKSFLRLSIGDDVQWKLLLNLFPTLSRWRKQRSVLTVRN